jgi:hypothetical protein
MKTVRLTAARTEVRASRKAYEEKRQAQRAE